MDRSIRLNNDIELQRYLEEFYGNLLPESESEYCFIFKMNEGTIPLSFSKYNEYYLTELVGLDWVSIHSDRELREYIRERYSICDFREAYNYEKRLMREQGLAVLSGFVDSSIPSYPCEITDILTDCELVDWLLDTEESRNIVKRQIERLQELCFEYPPNLQKIEEILDEVSDFHDFYYINLGTDYVMDNSDFLGWFISEYFTRINEDWFGKYVYNEETEEYDFICPDRDNLPELKRETYVTEIVKLFLEHGYDLHHLHGLVGASCLDALVYSYFNDEMCNIARLLIEHGADPTIGNEEGDTVIDTIEGHYFAQEDIRGCLEDDYLDNLPSSQEYAKICIDAATSIYSGSFPVHELWYADLIHTLPKGFDELEDCSRCGCKHTRICCYKNGSMLYLICPECGFHVKNVACDKDEFTFLANHWNSSFIKDLLAKQDKQKRTRK